MQFIFNPQFPTSIERPVYSCRCHVMILTHISVEFLILPCTYFVYFSVIMSFTTGELSHTTLKGMNGNRLTKRVNCL